MKLNRHPFCTERSAERGVALVITLVMLSVTLVMAVAYLALARRERGAVSTVTDTTTAKLAADSALAAAQSQILANVLATNVGTYNFGLLVSTNYINPNGFDPLSPPNPNNVSYNYNGGGPLGLHDFETNVANLKFLPRVPVFIQTNPGSPLDFRFYLDLNRNGQFDDTGNNLPNIQSDGTTNGFGVTATGDPQWVGILARPDLSHSANNLFLARYAFIALPVGNTLDINAIHNQPYRGTVDVNNTTYASSLYLRNEGVGSWEINLAAFLTDLNTNQWDVVGFGNDYAYLEPANPNTGAAFQDAQSILSYRYNYNYNSPLSTIGVNYLALGGQPFDLNLTGPLLAAPPVQYYLNDPFRPWPGADNTNHYYNLPSDLFDASKSSPGLFGFTNRLLKAGTESSAPNPDTYDRYTYYRMLAQLGTDSDPDDGKMNLNFKNINNGVVVPNMETNCIAWSSLDFFTNAADRMLRMYTTNWFGANPYAYLQTYYGLTPGNYNEGYTNASGYWVTNDATGFGLTNFYDSSSPFLRWVNVAPGFGITNIPVYVNGQFVYSPAVNRVLQLAANLYDASTTNYYPSVFRPIFELDSFNNLFIVGYTNVASVLAGAPQSDLQLSAPDDVTHVTQSGAFPKGFPLYINIYGIPWIIGAKANLPSFNQLAMLNIVQANRVLQVGRKMPDGTIYTNHLYELSISNSLSASFWNSYSNDYYPHTPGVPITLVFSDILSLSVSNSDTGSVGFQVFRNGFTNSLNDWPGSKWARTFGEMPAANSFLTANYSSTYFSNIIYKTQAKIFDSLDPNIDPDPFESNNVACDLLPAMSLVTTNWMRAIIVDGTNVIDYVQLRGPMDATNFSAVLNDPDALAGQPYFWATNTFGGAGGPSYGYVNQINVSQGNATPLPGTAVWNPVGYPGNANSKLAAQAYFNAWFQPAPHSFTDDYGNTGYATNPVVQAGYTATRTIFVPYLYQVNDPLVHYTVNDLNAGPGAVWANEPAANGVWAQAYGVLASKPVPVLYGTNMVIGRYQPWGVAAPTTLQSSGYDFGNALNPIYKDPGVWDPDYWYFPTNKYPAVGWIGRVHRGTPWQTVYLKALNLVEPYDSVGSNTWAAWTGDVNNLYDAANSGPVQDRLLFDLFTARPNDNATRGTLSVNQTNIAAWSAVLSGVVVLTNLEPWYKTSPNTAYPASVLGKMLGAPTKNLPFPIANNGYNIIQPAGGAGDNSTLAQLVAAINSQRVNATSFYGFTNADGVAGAFEHVGDILSVPQLTGQSPYLNTNAAQQAFGLSDAAYEWLPQQAMGLLRESPEPRYVIYGYGQSLRPAPNGLDNNNAAFGLITNYQVVAESAVRAVVSVRRQINLSGAYPVTNYTTRVESYNVLPSD